MTRIRELNAGGSEAEGMHSDSLAVDTKCCYFSYLDIKKVL